MPEINPPFFSDWLSVFVLVLAMSGTWGGMIAMLKSIQRILNEFRDEMREARKGDREWMEESLKEILNGHKDLARLIGNITSEMKSDRESFYRALRDNEKTHNEDHERIGLQISESFATSNAAMASLIAKVEELIRAK